MVRKYCQYAQSAELPFRARAKSLPGRSQKAQGMVEFALVMMFLLVLIFGIIAFSHLFFVYSMVVSSSREAARWGAVVGVTGAGVPRYRDCDSIKAAAVRVGKMVGVSPANVTITYDHGPTTPPEAPFGTCPMPSSTYGPEESQVVLGDRILINVTVNYRPIVPLINIPTVPITATTARTIVKGLPIGHVTMAASPDERER